MAPSTFEKFDSRGLTFLTYRFRCSLCYSNCETCTGPSESNCTTCRSGFFELGKKCHSQCPPGFYGDAKRRECIPCSPNCHTCDNNVTCIQCSHGYVRNSDGKCVTEGSQLCRRGTDYLNYLLSTLRSRKVWSQLRTSAVFRILRVLELKFQIFRNSAILVLEQL